MKHYLHIFALLLLSLSTWRCSESGFSAEKSDSSSANNVGQAGSLASMLIVGDFLYSIAGNQLRTYSIKDADRLKPIASLPIWDFSETLFHRNGLLFVGSRSGMFIFQIQQDGTPKSAGTFTHATGCDPVVANDQLAFVTVHNATTCRAIGNVNELTILNINDPFAPRVMGRHAMTSPLGMGLRGSILYLCEQAAGLKVIEYQSDGKIKVLHHYRDVHALDVIVLPQSMLLLTPKDIVQYTYEADQGLKAVSKMPILP